MSNTKDAIRTRTLWSAIHSDGNICNQAMTTGDCPNNHKWFKSGEDESMTLDQILDEWLRHNQMYGKTSSDIAESDYLVLKNLQLTLTQMFILFKPVVAPKNSPVVRVQHKPIFERN